MALADPLGLCCRSPHTAIYAEVYISLYHFEGRMSTVIDSIESRGELKVPRFGFYP